MKTLLQRFTTYGVAFSTLFLLLLAGCAEDTPTKPDETTSPEETTSLNNGRIYTTRVTGSSVEILSMLPDGSNQRILRQNVRITSVPQGEKLVMVTKSGALILTDLEGNTIRSIPTVASADMATLSPDGNTICYGYWDKLSPFEQFYTLRTLRSDGTGDVLIIGQAGISQSRRKNMIAFSPDSKRILFSAPINNNGENDTLYTVKADGTERQLVTDNARSGGLAWSPSGDRILFMQEGNRNEPQIWTIKPDGSDERQLTNISNSRAMFPTFSPDGTMIAFKKITWDQEGAELWVMNSDGSNQRQLTNTPGYGKVEVEAKWSPDSKSILYMILEILNPGQPDPPTGKLKTIDVATGTTSVLVATRIIDEAFWGRK